MRRRVAAACLGLMVACGLASRAPAAEPPPPPFTGPVQVSSLPETEQRIWAEVADLERAFRRGGQLIDDAETEAYLAALMDRLYPGFGPAFRLRVIRDPEMNAFCLPNGGIYVNLGLLARVRNEDQLAAILAHEGGHFTHRHGVRQHESAVTTAAWVRYSRLAGGLPGKAIGSLLGLSSISGFSRELEREADLAGFGRLTAAGFDPREAVRMFESLYEESKAQGLKESVFFASHPRLQERIESFRALIAAAPAASAPAASAPVDSARLRTLQPRLQREWMELEASLGHDARLIHQLTRPDAATFFPPEAPYYLGEAYRRRGDATDRERMLAAYGEALARAPGFAPVHAALGAHHFKNRDCAAASPELHAYLDMAPDGPMAGHARRMLEKCR